MMRWLAIVLFAGPAWGACVEVEASADWMLVPTEGAILDAYATGLWTADPALRATGPGGHRDAEGARVAAPYPLGALLIASEAKVVWSYRDFQRSVMGAMLAGRPFDPGRLYARINDAADAEALADNTGSVTLCLEPAG